MGWNDLVGNAGLKRQLTAACTNRGFSHAYLISGPEGSGKETLARLLAEALVCTGEGEVPCGHCLNCRKVRERIHPDVVDVDLLEGKREILVDQVRKMRADALILPNEGKRKIYILHAAHTMNRNAQNAILKILEEGPTYAVFMLLAENAGSMLPTIRSRCEGLVLTPVRQEEAEAWLTERFPQVSRKDVRAAAAECDGVLGGAVARLSKAEGERVSESAQMARELVRAYAAGDEAGMAELCGGLERKKVTREALCKGLDELTRLIRDALALRAGTAVKVGPEEMPVAREAGRRLSEKALSEAANAVKELRRDADFYVNTSTLCMALCARLAETARL